MKTTTNLETDNLVLFPSAKNFEVESDLSDPMMDLLSEFSHLSDDDIPSYLDDRFDEEESEEEAEENDGSEIYESLEAYMNRHKIDLSLSPDETLVSMINEKFEAIMEAKARIKFYLDEIDMFLPRRR